MNEYFLAVLNHSKEKCFNMPPSIDFGPKKDMIFVHTCKTSFCYLVH
jgi:hypothetical protein